MALESLARRMSQDKGASQRSAALLADTEDRMRKQLSANLRWAYKKNGDCRLEYIGRPVQLETMKVVGGLDSRTEPLATTSPP
jgi:hypothetical protein